MNEAHEAIAKLTEETRKKTLADIHARLAILQLNEVR